MKCDIGRLQAYLDDALTAEERRAVQAHLPDCDVCQARLKNLRQRGEGVAMRLAALDPKPHETPDPAAALAQFRALVQPVQPFDVLTPSETEGVHPSLPRWNTAKETIEMMKQTLLTGRWRPAAIGLVALACVVALFSFAPARQAAAQFLGIFRVRKFAVIPVDPAQVKQLESLGDLADAGVFGEPTLLREPGEPTAVADAAEASTLAGFGVRAPALLPDGATLRKFTVETGPLMHFEVDRTMMQALLQAAGVKDVTLPPMDTVTVEVDIPAMVEQSYRTSGGTLSIIQLPSPTVTVPPGVDPAAFGEILLRLLGMPAADAQHVAQSIDWTSTLVIPLPTDVGRFHEVEVDGGTGLLLEEQSRSYQRHRMVLWQRNDIIYSIEGQNIDPTELLRIASSLH